MKKLLFVLTVFGLLLGVRAYAQSPEEMYKEYITPEVQAVMDRFDEAQEQIQAAEKASNKRKTFAMAVSLLAGLIPIGYLGRDIIRKRTWKDNPFGTLKAVGIGLVGGAVLFGLNYGVFLLKYKMGDAFNTVLAFLIVAAIIVGSIYLLNKKD